MAVLTRLEVKVPEQILYEWFTERVWEEDLYLDLANRGNIYVELDDGRIVFPMMPTVTHQTAVLNLASALWAYARSLPVPGRVLIAPAPIRLWPLKIREPDVVFYKAEHLDRVGEQVSGVPDFVAEVLLPSSLVLDTGQKMMEIRPGRHSRVLGGGSRPSNRYRLCPGRNSLSSGGGIWR